MRLRHGLMPYDAAWRLTRVIRHPDKLVYRTHLPEDPEDTAS
ncbi:hypothetical protein [Streptomyces sp. NBC_01363]|nr:hypothetical protein [Streptomyces sp. NBC_01363]MCX4736604.1 hypothetical protein [Streptomyces sp. NBC_01363]